MAKFEVGKKVVCIKTSEHANRNGVIRGRVFEVCGIKKCGCGCGDERISVGIPSNNNIKTCSTSGRDWMDYSGYWWHTPSLFAPIDEISRELSETTLADILEPELQNV